MDTSLATYIHLLALNARVFWESLKLDGAVLLVGLWYIFGGRSALHITISRGVLMLAASVWVALMASQIIKRNSAPLICYLRWPLDRRFALALFDLAFILPSLVIFVFFFCLCRTVSLRAGHFWDPALLTQRFFQTVLVFLFIKSLTVNLMMAIRIHFALIVLHFVILGGILLALMILQEVVSPLLIINKTDVAALFLLATYAIGFVSIGKLRL